MNKPADPNDSSITTQPGGLLAQTIAEQGRLARFFSKLLGEAFFLESDEISFALGSDAVAVAMRRGKEELKTISIKPSWFIPLCGWLARRPNVLADEYPEIPWVIDGTRPALDCEIAARLGSEVAVFRAQTQKPVGGRQVLTLSELRKTPLQSYVERLGMSGSTALLYEQLCAHERGLLIVAAPDREQLRQQLACMLSLTGLPLAGSMSDTETRAEFSSASQSETLLIAVVADDASDAVMKLKEFGLDIQRTVICGAICQVIVRRTCGACARKTPVDRALSDMIPTALRPASWDSYLVGRGCERCGQHGQRGVLGIQSILCMNPEIEQLFKAGGDQAALLKSAYPLGTRSLMEDGMAKVSAGQVTLQALFNVVRGLPTVYVEQWNSLHPSRSSALPAPGLAAAAVSEGPLFGAPPLVAQGKPVVLVVEDDADQRSILDMVFRASNYEVLAAENGRQALKLLRTTKPDLIISDLMMPEMDGAEFVSAVRSNPLLQSIPILILTVVADGDKEYSLLDLGADDYVEKTVQRKVLLKRAERLLRRSKPAA